ncbi:MAG: hypothetical protein AAB577_02165 [Patescibacteria group bacterium]
MKNNGRLKVLIVYGYHPKEVFAVETGKHLSRDAPSSDIKVVEYNGRFDEGVSTYYLRKFVETFDPLVSPVVLHGDDDMGADMAIIYRAKSKQARRAAHRPLLEFCFDRSNCGNEVIVWGRFLTHNNNYGVIDIELDSRMGIEKSAAMIRDFSQYLIGLYLEKKVRL